MKTAIVTLAALLVSAAVSAQEYVPAHVDATGAYVPGYIRTAPDITVQPGAVNPYIPPTTVYVVPAYAPAPMYVPRPLPAQTSPLEIYRMIQQGFDEGAARERQNCCG